VDQAHGSDDDTGAGAGASESKQADPLGYDGAASSNELAVADSSRSESADSGDHGLPVGTVGKRTAEVMRLCSWIHENALIAASAHRRATGQVVYVSPSGFL